MVILQATAQNPLILDQFTADPSARVFERKVYVYPSHDIPCQEGHGFIGFCMADYHVFSSENLTDWEDHGIIVSQENVDWVHATSYSMWAPDCIFRDGKYYFYFPAVGRDTVRHRGMRIGVAISDTPYGPFHPEPEPISGIFGIDPNVFIDHDGQAYIYWAGRGQLLGARLKDNMLELASEPQEIGDLPEKFKEGPFLFERNGIYYFTFPYVPETTEQLVYAMGDNPMGPFRYTGVIMDESPTGCWTNHHSILEYQGQWYLFYHHNDLSPDFDKNRSIRADSLFFNNDGTIRKVTPTLRGVGVTHAGDRIEIDRYSAIGDDGTAIAYLDSTHKQKGWKIILSQKGAWTRYNTVDFGNGDLKKVELKVSSDRGGIAELRLGSTQGSLIARVDIPGQPGWTIVDSGLRDIPSGIHHLVTTLVEGDGVEIDWLRFQ